MAGHNNRTDSSLAIVVLAMALFTSSSIVSWMTADSKSTESLYVGGKLFYASLKGENYHKELTYVSNYTIFRLYKYRIISWCLILLFSLLTISLSVNYAIRGLTRKNAWLVAACLVSVALSAGGVAFAAKKTTLLRNKINSNADTSYIEKLKLPSKIVRLCLTGLSVEFPLDSQLFFDNLVNEAHLG